jgi:hypothetical protein
MCLYKSLQENKFHISKPMLYIVECLQGYELNNI